MTQTRTERVQLFADIHIKARMKAGKSQEFMAIELGVAKKTVQNWEKGLSSPSFFQSLEWFRVLNANPFPYYMSLMYPKEYKNIKQANTDDEINEAFDTLIKQISIEDKRALLYIYYGAHGGDPHTIINLMLAHLHTPLQARVTQAMLTYYIYEMHSELDNLICKDDIMPNMKELNDSIMRARVAALQKSYGYSVLDMVKAFAKASGKEINYKIAPRRPGDIAECFADPEKAYKELGFKATRNLEDMCRDTWRWQEGNKNGYKK